MANPNLKRIVKTSTTLSLKGTLDSDTGSINTEEDNYDLLVLLEFFDDKEIDFSITTKGCSVKLKGFYSKAVVTTEEGCEFDVLDMIRPLGYMEVKVNVKCVEEKDETPEE
jgi:hypothetical protein